MDRRHAKRFACVNAATILEHSAEGFGLWVSDGLSDKDSKRVEEAIIELVEELRRRGGRCEPQEEDDEE
mgnify:CR=1 FL=1